MSDAYFILDEIAFNILALATFIENLRVLVWANIQLMCSDKVKLSFPKAEQRRSAYYLHWGFGVGTKCISMDQDLLLASNLMPILHSTAQQQESVFKHCDKNKCKRIAWSSFRILKPKND